MSEESKKKSITEIFKNHNEFKVGIPTLFVVWLTFLVFIYLKTEWDSTTVIFNIINISIFLIFLINILKLLSGSLSHLNILNEITQNLKKENLIGECGNIKNKLKKENEYLAKLWNEFDETFVKSENSIHNTVDTIVFFNTSTLGNGIFGNRLLAAVPGFLTGLGVLGTFYGLSQGLASISFENVKDLTTSIKPLIEGASIAFVTSIIGVINSLFFNFIEKIIESSLKKKIVVFQNKIDFLFPRKLIESSLTEIEGSSQETVNIMTGLAEQIGDKMQTALLESSDKIGEQLQFAISNTMTPAIEKLVKAAEELTGKQANGSEEALKSLIENFSAGISKEGQEQQKALANVAEQVNSSFTSLGNQMNSFLSELQKQTESTEEKERERLKAFEERENKRAEAFEEKFTNLIEEANKQFKSSELLITKNSELLTLQESNYLKWETLLNKVDNTSSNFNTISKNLFDFGNTVSSASEIFKVTQEKTEESNNKVSESNQRLAKENSKTAEAFKETIDYLENVLTGFNHLEQVTNEMVNSISQTPEQFRLIKKELESSLGCFREEIESSINTYKEGVDKMLENYSSRVQGQTIERLKTWDKETSNFTSAMTEATNTINEVVEDIADKISKSNKGYS